MSTDRPNGLLERVIYFCIQRKVVVGILVLLAVVGGVTTAPFDWDVDGIPRDPVPVDAIPDIGENQQIVFTSWSGRSPQDVEDQITYPLTVSLLGIPGVKTVRSFSMFGFSTIYVIFQEDVEFYWSRTRILEKLASLPANTLPVGVEPTLGPDATALGQVYWYTIEGRDSEGNPTGGWDLHELRSVQDWYVRYGLTSVPGVSEVASIGGFVQEYQVDVNPDALLAYGVSLADVHRAVSMSNIDVGARTIELNRVEYVIRGVGLIRSVDDIASAVITAKNGTPVLVRHVADVNLGPAVRRGVLDKDGAEVVGGVVVVRFGDNPMAAIQAVKARIAELSLGLPSKPLPDGRVSQLTIVPFYDRTELIDETLGTLRTALSEEILVTIIVVLVMVMHLASSLLIAGLLPLAILMCFIAMKLFGVDANVVALSGIAIAIGTMVDMGIVVSENIYKHVQKAPGRRATPPLVFAATREVSGAVVTAVATTVVSFLPVFAMTGAEGKLFQPLAFTKTLALLASIVVALFVLPAAAQVLFRGRTEGRKAVLPYVLLLAGFGLTFKNVLLGVALVVLAVAQLLSASRSASVSSMVQRYGNWAVVLISLIYLASSWMPLGIDARILGNVVFVGLLLGGVLGLLLLFQKHYSILLAWCLIHKRLFLAIPLVSLAFGAIIWFGFSFVFGFLPQRTLESRPLAAISATFPGLGREFMPSLDEGAFLFMPTTMPHASIGEAYDVLRKQDIAISSLPEVKRAVGKIGRTESPLDPAPISMIETIINYHSEFLLDNSGKRARFRFNPGANDLFRRPDGTPALAPDGKPYLVSGTFERDDDGALIADANGRPFRLWRPALTDDLNSGRRPWPGIQGPDDIWAEITRVASVPGTTGAPKLQPIAARIVMLQSGMRAPMGIKVKGPDLATIEAFGMELERLLKQVPGVRPAAVIADRIVGKPYLEIHIDRDAIARHGVNVQQVQDVIETAVGGKAATKTVQGRERYSVRVRYQRELRDSPEAIARILVATPSGAQVPLGQLAEIKYQRGPQVIKSEDTFLVGYVVFDREDDIAEVDIVERASAFLQNHIDSGHLTVPTGVSYQFTGSYENQVRAQKRLSVIVPVALAIIFLILYLQFSSLAVSAMVFSGVALAWTGGFILIWLYGQPWFLGAEPFGVPLRELFQIAPVNLSVAVWVGFLALFGIATDNGVIVATYLQQSFRDQQPQTAEELRSVCLTAGLRRVRPCVMTTATTLLALLPVLTSTGRGADIMVPMAIPSFGGMLFVLISTLMVPVLFSAKAELSLPSDEHIARDRSSS